MNKLKKLLWVVAFILVFVMGYTAKDVPVIAQMHTYYDNIFPVDTLRVAKFLDADSSACNASISELAVIDTATFSMLLNANDTCEFGTDSTDPVLINGAMDLAGFSDTVGMPIGCLIYDSRRDTLWFHVVKGWVPVVGKDN